MNPIEWLLNGDTGVSSKTICAVMCGTTIKGGFGADIPHDPADFARCYKLLALFPEWRARLGEVASQYPIWGPMVEAWDELTALYEEESAAGRYAPKLYARMQELSDAGKLADGWKRTGKNSWEGPSRKQVSLGNGLTIGFQGKSL